MKRFYLFLNSVGLHGLYTYYDCGHSIKRRFAYRPNPAWNLVLQPEVKMNRTNRTTQIKVPIINRYSVDDKI